MEDAKIEWYSKVGSDEKFALDNDVYAGTYTDGHPIVVTLQLWNNRWGTADVLPLKDFFINMYFKDREDKNLFEYCSVRMGNEILSFIENGTYVTLEFPKAVEISGIKNNGIAKDNPKNFIELEFTFRADGANLKEHDLKSLFFEIKKNS